jgi:hypothetical protein
MYTPIVSTQLGGVFAMKSAHIMEKPSANPAHLYSTQKSPEIKAPRPGAEHEPHGQKVEWRELGSASV